MKIVIDDKIPYINGVLEPYAEVVFLSGRSINRDVLVDADALLVRTRTRCDAALLAGTKVRLVATATIGTDHIDKRWCEENGIEVVSAPGCNAGGVLQWIAAVLVTIADRRGTTPSELTLGVVGVGHVGSLVEQYAVAWGFNVLRSDPPREHSEHLVRDDGYVPLAELAAQSDIVTFHVPFTSHGDYPTAGLGDVRFFENLKKDAVVVNASRGGVVDEELLYEYIKSGKCSACIDTWAGEPELNAGLLELSSVATTHIAGYSVQGKANATAAVVAAVAENFSLPLKGWYPPQVARVARGDISWSDVCDTVYGYCDLVGETAALKQNRSDFERIREEYRFREEYF